MEFSNRYGKERLKHQRLIFVAVFSRCKPGGIFVRSMYRLQLRRIKRSSTGAHVNFQMLFVDVKPGSELFLDSHRSLRASFLNWFLRLTSWTANYVSRNWVLLTRVPLKIAQFVNWKRSDVYSEGELYTFFLGTLMGQATELLLFFFLFREVDADSSNCNFTIRFLIRIHGLPPGSLNPSSVIVLVSKRVGQ